MAVSGASRSLMLISEADEMSVVGDGSGLSSIEEMGSSSDHSISTSEPSSISSKNAAGDSPSSNLLKRLAIVSVRSSSKNLTLLPKPPVGGGVSRLCDGGVTERFMIVTLQRYDRDGRRTWCCLREVAGVVKEVRRVGRGRGGRRRFYVPARKGEVEYWEALLESYEDPW